MKETPARILVVDDEENIADLLSASLRFVGFDVQTAGTRRAALSKVASFRPQIVLLDVMLPDLDGFEVCKRMRMDGEFTPVLFLTAKDTAEDKVRGLTLGGDDYVTKPFSLEEVVARVHALLRRNNIATTDSQKIVYQDLEMDEDAHRVFRGEEEIELSPTEYNLLRYLLVNSGRVLSKSQILDHVWEYDFGGDGAVVETYVSYLRKKIDKGRDPLIHTVRGVGYVLRKQ